MPCLIPSSCNFCATRQACIPSPCTPSAAKGPSPSERCLRGSTRERSAGSDAERGEKHRGITNNSSGEMWLTLIAAPSCRDRGIGGGAFKAQPPSFSPHCAFKYSPVFPVPFKTHFLLRRIEIACKREGERPLKVLPHTETREGQMSDSEPRVFHSQ